MNFKKQRFSCKAYFIAIFLLLGFAFKAAAQKYTYAEPSSYAIPLYGVNADTLLGADKTASGFLLFTKNGRATWHVNITGAGLYRLRGLYACDTAGISVQINANRKTFNLSLPQTTGYYRKADYTLPRGALWPHGLGAYPMQNYNRLDFGIIVNLKTGKNTLSLKATVPAGHPAFYFRGLELIPVNKQKAIDAELADAKASRADPSWLMNAGYGLMFHWDNTSVPPRGPASSYTDAVNNFDVKAFAAMVKKTGASYVIFTPNHGNINFPAPIKEWEAMHPGGTTKRDLVMEMADALNAQGIKFIMYMHTQTASDPNYTSFKSHTTKMTERDFAESAIKIVTAIGNRYGNRVAGYWFDSFLDIELQYPHFPYQRFYEAAKAGNPNRLVAITNWAYPILTAWQDYYGGELFVPGNPPTTLPLSGGPAKGLPFQALITLFGDWVHHQQDTPIAPPIYSVNELGDFIKATEGKGSVTINTGLYQDGTIGEQQTLFYDQLRQYVYGK